jgi:flagella basal body P-ring formation protein FlgA
MKILFISLVLSPLAALACEVQLASRLLVTRAAVADTWPLGSKKCSAAELQSVHALFVEQHGDIPLARLQAAVGESITLLSGSASVRIENIDNIVRSQFSQSLDTVATLTPLYQQALIELPMDADLKTSCHPCRFESDEQIRLTVKTFGQQPQDLLYGAKFSRMVEAYRLRRTLPAFSSHIDPLNLEKVRVPESRLTKYFTDIGKLRFFKTNKTLRAGELLRTSDFVAQTLVKAGDGVELIFENAQIKVKSHAMSRQNGGLGDSVEVWNQANGRKHRGRIVEQGKVLVEL